MKTTLTEKAIGLTFTKWWKYTDQAEYGWNSLPKAELWAAAGRALETRLQREQARARAKLAPRVSGCLEVALLGFLASETSRDEKRWATCAARLARVATKAGLDPHRLALATFPAWVLEAALEIGSKP
jgi:hypothetical protein